LPPWNSAECFPSSQFFLDSEEGKFGCCALAVVFHIVLWCDCGLIAVPANYLSYHRSSSTPTERMARQFQAELDELQTELALRMSLNDVPADLGANGDGQQQTTVNVISALSRFAALVACCFIRALYFAIVFSFLCETWATASAFCESRYSLVTVPIIFLRTEQIVFTALRNAGWAVNAIPASRDLCSSPKWLVPNASAQRCVPFIMECVRCDKLRSDREGYMRANALTTANGLSA
jgi:hypothetical protein